MIFDLETLKKEAMNEIADHFININILNKESKKFFKMANLKKDGEYVSLFVFPLYYLSADFSKKEERIKNTKFIWEVVQTMTMKKHFQYHDILFLTKKLEEKSMYHGICYDIKASESSLKKEYLVKFNIFPKVNWKLVEEI